MPLNQKTTSTATMFHHTTLCVLLPLLLITAGRVQAQNVGVGTATPSKKFSVAGSVAVDHGNDNNGSLDSAALVFNLPARSGITSNRSALQRNQYGLDFWTGKQKRLSITDDGKVGIGVDTPGYNLQVKGWTATDKLTSYGTALLEGDVFVGSDLHVDETANVKGQLNINGPTGLPGSRLSVNGISYFGGTSFFTSHILADGDIESWNSVVAHNQVYGAGSVLGGSVESLGNAKVAGYAAVGGNVDSLFRLRVYGGPSRFGGDVAVVGNISVNSINGSGVVRSAGASSLRMGFNSLFINAVIGGGGQFDYTATITAFSGTADDVRVFVSQFMPDAGAQYANWHDFSFHVHSIDAADNTCKLRLVNNTNGQLSIRGTLYLTSVARE